MTDVVGFAKRRAQKLHVAAMALEQSGSLDEAIAKYKEAIRADPQKSESYYNIGLIYKYRSAWSDSFAYNRSAYDLAPEDEAARWNLAIAATALRDWTVARPDVARQRYRAGWGSRSHQ